ncbi:MAG: Spy/CpxP family protein refolding chaperone [Betaproteobacteria bacterium]|nr:Spy/CpxP family protein refolding chaperone [Betaproteobacteria bacterium]
MKPARHPLLWIAAGCLTAGAAFAADTAPPAPPAGMAAMPHRMPMRDPQAMAQKRLDRLQRELHLKPTQQAAWADYRNAVTAMAAQRAAQPPMGGPDAARVPLPQRLREHAAMMRAHADQMDKLAAQTQTLYQVLSPEQQTIFELASRPGRHGMHGPMMMGGMGMHGPMAMDGPPMPMDPSPPPPAPRQ